MSYIGNQITGFLGTGSLTVTTSTVAVEGDALFSADGNVVLGDASGDTITINAATASIPNNLNIDSNTLFLNASNNRVGIGNASPATALDVAGTITSDGLTVDGTATEVKFTTTAGRMDLFLTDTDTTDGQVRIRGDANTLSFITNTTNALTIDASQNVGIGTSSPNSYTGFTVLTINNATNGAEIDFEKNGTVQGSIFTPASTNDLTITAAHASGDLVFQSGGYSNRMRLDTSGNLLVGKESSDMTTTGSEVQDGAMRIVASSTSTNLATNSGASFLLANPNSTNGNFSNIGSYNTNQLVDSQINFIHENHSSRTGAISFNTHDGSSLGEVMRLTSGGNVLVGMSSSSGTADGLRIRPNDFVGFTTNATDADDRLVLLNRQASDGKFIEFRKANAFAGSIYTNAADGGSSAELCISSGNTGLKFDDTNNYIRPTNSAGAHRDNIVTLGDDNSRFKDLYLGGNIYLGGTGSANALSDYEEGSWTPASPDGTITVNGTPTYVKIGKMVFVQANVTMFTSSSGTQAKIDGLPFAVDGNGTNSQYNLSPGEHTYGGYITMPVIPTTNRIIFRPNGGTSTSYNTVSGKNFRFSGWYETT